MPNEYKVTVFTPTYNRAYVIEKLYRSLQRQTCTDFEWLVVDDGSVDGTEQLFDGWRREESSFPIRYYRQENGGKYRAINYGLELAQGVLFFTVDSDDYLTDDALEKIVNWEASLPANGHYCGLAGNLSTSCDAYINTVFEGGYHDGTALDRYSVADGERAMVFYTDVHRKYLYPDHPGEKFMTEAVTWNRMAADGYRIRFYNDIIWIYEYLEDGLTSSGYKLFLNNPRGFGLFLKEKAEFLRASPKEIFWMWYGYACDLEKRCTKEQIAQYIGMPLPLVGFMQKVHRVMNFLKGKTDAQ